MKSQTTIHFFKIAKRILPLVMALAMELQVEACM